MEPLTCRAACGLTHRQRKSWQQPVQSSFVRTRLNPLGTCYIGRHNKSSPAFSRTAATSAGEPSQSPFPLPFTAGNIRKYRPGGMDGRSLLSA